MTGEYLVQIKKSEKITPHMQRVTLHGTSLEAFPPDEESGYVKVQFPQVDGSKTVPRSFTIRDFDQQRSELVLDIVDHGDQGVAAKWLNECAAGDEITIKGPGEKKLVDPNADWFFIAGDMTALPAISVNLATLPDDAKGYAIIQVSSEEDKQSLKIPKGIELQWFVNDSPEDASGFIRAIRQKPWLAGTPYPWFAGEFETMRQVRKYFRDEKKINRKQMYVSSYWKHGDTDEGMKQAKRLDPDV